MRLLSLRMLLVFAAALASGCSFSPKVAVENPGAPRCKADCAERKLACKDPADACEKRFGYCMQTCADLYPPK